MSDQRHARRHEASGKVREMYGYGDQMLMVASDRISAFDVVLPTPIPHKGRVLTGAVAVLVRRAPTHIVPNHLISVEPERRSPSRRGGPRPGRPIDARPAADDAADRVRRPRLPGRLGLEGLPGHRRGVRPRAAAGLRAGREAAGRRSSRRRPRTPRATTSTSTARPAAAPGRRGALDELERALDRGVRGGRRRTPRRAASSSPTPSSSSASTDRPSWCWATRC